MWPRAWWLASARTLNQLGREKRRVGDRGAPWGVPAPSFTRLYKQLSFPRSLLPLPWWATHGETRSFFEENSWSANRVAHSLLHYWLQAPSRSITLTLTLTLVRLEAELALVESIPSTPMVIPSSPTAVTPSPLAPITSSPLALANNTVTTATIVTTTATTVAIY
jgi:hypothetical protein